MAPTTRAWSRYAVIWAASITALAIPSAAAAQRERDDLLNCYYDARTTDPPKARTCLQSAVAKYPSDKTAWLELGYLEIARKENEAAIGAFEKIVALDPADEQARMQLAYLLDAAGRKREAYRLFNQLGQHSDDSTRRTQACRSAEVLAAPARKRLPAPGFAEIYAAPDYYDNLHTGTLPLEARAGVELAGGRTEIYGQFRFLADSSSGKNSAGEPQRYFDNVATLAGGVRVRPFEKLGLVLLTETGSSYDLIDLNRPRWSFNRRAGAIYYGEWSMASACPRGFSMPFRPVLDIYGESLFFSRFDNNVISDMRIRPGVRAIETSTLSLDVHFHAAAMTDTNADPSNRFFEFGPGARLAPDRRRPGRLAWETVWRHYTDGRRELQTRMRIEYGLRW